MREPSPQYLSTHEVASLLRRSVTTVYRLTQRQTDPLPGKRLGGTLLFIAEEVHQWIERQPAAAPQAATHG